MVFQQGGNLQLPASGRIAVSYEAVIPIPGYKQFQALPPKAKGSLLNWKMAEGTVVYEGRSIAVRWAINLDSLPSVAEYKFFCELVCAYAAKSGGFTKVNIRGPIHNTTRASLAKPIHLRTPQEKDWHITADFAGHTGNGAPRSAHIYVGPLAKDKGGWGGYKENINRATMGIWRPEYRPHEPREPAIEWFNIDHKSEFAKSGRR